MRALVVTTVAEPSALLRRLSAQAAATRTVFIAIGDEATPPTFDLPGCDYYDLERQRTLGLATAEACPTRHYARKNVGYLVAMRQGATAIVETDDDSEPYATFWRTRLQSQRAAIVDGPDWVNAYAYFTDARIWPRGLPLDAVQTRPPARELLREEDVCCPIQQGLVDGDPDVDAIYRLVLDLPFEFDVRPSVALGAGTWCPFNSQNTTWWPDAYELMYLPAYCSFRLTDIWRSFVAQWIAWANDWRVLFHAPTVRQHRNPHDLLRDFRDEVAGYLANRELCAALADVEVAPGVDNVPAGVRAAYRRLAERGFIDPRELPLVEAWLADVAAIRGERRAAAHSSGIPRRRAASALEATPESASGR
jgi:hypothetical protein